MRPRDEQKVTISLSWEDLDALISRAIEEAIEEFTKQHSQISKNEFSQAFFSSLAGVTSSSYLQSLSLTINQWWEQVKRRARGEYETDKYGYDSQFVSLCEPAVTVLHHYLFDCQAIGTHFLNLDGPFLIIMNSSHFLFPWEIMVMEKVLSSFGEKPYPCNGLYPESLNKLPFMALLLQRRGHLAFNESHIERLLDEGKNILVLPDISQRENVKIEKKAVAIALRRGIPMIPCAIKVEYEKSTTGVFIHQSLTLWRKMFRLFSPLEGIDHLFSSLPFPSRWQVQFLEPVIFQDIPSQERTSPAQINAITRLISDEIEIALSGAWEKE